MINAYNNFFSMANVVNREYTLIPVAGNSSFINGVDDSKGLNYRNPTDIEEIHNLEITATSLQNNINSSWNAIIDIYIVDIHNNNATFSLIQNLALSDKTSYHNEKTITLLPHQSLCYKIKSITSTGSGNNYNINVSASCIDFKDPSADYFLLTVVPVSQDVDPDTHEHLPIDNAQIYLKYTSLTGQITESTSGSIMLPSSMFVEYSITANRFIPRSGRIEVTGPSTTILQLEPLRCVKIASNTRNAEITLQADGYTQEGDEIWVRANTRVTWSVTAPYAIPQEGEVTPTSSNVLLPIDLVPICFTYTIIPDPSNANVRLEADGYTQVDNSITVQGGTPVKWSVSLDGFATKSGTEVITDDLEATILLDIAIGRILFESNTPGVYDFDILRNGLYGVTIVGPGGKGASYRYKHRIWYYTSKSSSAAGGGSGAYVYGTTPLLIGHYDVIVGGESRRYSECFGLRANGGGDGSAGKSSASGGRGGTYSISDPACNGVIGNNGGAMISNSASANGGASVYEGYGAGASAAVGGASGNVVSPGYIKITYQGPLP